MDLEPQRAVKVADNLYRRPGSPFLYVVWHRRRRKCWKSTKTASLKEAKRLRDEFLGRMRSSALTRDERTTYEQLRQLLVDHYAIHDRTPSLEKFESTRAKHLDSYFKGMRAIEISEGGAIGRYVAQRKREGAANATINRETQALIQMLRIASSDQHRLIGRGLVPRIERLPEAPPRTGTVSDGEFDEILPRLAEWARPPIRAISITGWRVNAVLSRKKLHIDHERSVLILDRASSKNRIEYRWPLVGDMADLVKEQLEQIRLDERRLRRVIPWLFHRNGKKISYFSLHEAWVDAAKAAGYPGKLMHDFRRTVATRLEENKVPREIAKAMTGHKSDIMFTRYVQTRDDRLAEAAKLISVQNRKKGGSKTGAEGQTENQKNSEIPQ
jgi:integrase